MSIIRRVCASYHDKDRMTINLDAVIRVENGVLTKDEVSRLRTVVADRLMLVLADELPNVHAHISEVRVTR